jgi:steroid 5-alpha reductase family enzyme
MSFETALVTTAASASLLMVIAWLIQRRTGDAGIVDVIWAGSLGAAALAAAYFGPGDMTRRLVVASIAGIWSIRLTTYLFTDRILKAEHEDGRYLMLREQWGPSAQAWFFGFFQIQALFVLAFATPFFVAAYNATPFGVLDLLGISIWLVSLTGETIADRQLSRHRSDPDNKGKTCRTGLWAWSRHPNYFFEWLHWWSYVLIGFGSVWWWLSPAAAVFMLFLLFFVTGIPYTEKRAIASRGEDYRAYQRTTNVFIPWFPKEERTS